MEMKHTRENRLNSEHRDESQTFRAYFALMVPRKVLDLANQEQRLQNECLTLSSSLEGIFIAPWAPETNLKIEPNLDTKIGNQSYTHKILTKSDLADSP